MKLLVCGGRGYSDKVAVTEVLNRIHAKRPILVLIHGCAPGADTLANEWAEQHGVRRAPFPADWSRGPKAGPERNARMLDEKPDGVVAFPGGRGTADMTRRAEAAGVKVWRPLG